MHEGNRQIEHQSNEDPIDVRAKTHQAFDSAFDCARNADLPIFHPENCLWVCEPRIHALAAVFLALIAAVPTAMKGAAAKRRGANDEANWWLITTLILVSPLVLLIGPLG